jgi:flagellin
MTLGVLNNLSAIRATNSLNQSHSSMSAVLQQLSSGSRINSASDDAAALSLVDGIAGNISALSQSQKNMVEGVGLLQVADGALGQVTGLLNRAITLATEAGNGTLNTAQKASANQEYQSLISEINNIGVTTTYNQQQVFGTTTGIYGGDSTEAGATEVKLKISQLSSSNVGETNGSLTFTPGTTGSPGTPSMISYTSQAGEDLSGTDLLTESGAQSAATKLNTAVIDTAAQRAYLGSQVNTLNAMSNVFGTQEISLRSAQDSVQATDYGAATSALSKFQVLDQTGISALAEANSSAQLVTKLLQ